jgi:hypothetical protein
MSISVNWQEFACIGIKTPTSGFLAESLRKVREQHGRSAHQA